MDKTKLPKICLKNFIKDSPGRLTSIKLPRDLSLGGTKMHKKVYKPNLNVVRNKTSTENKPKNLDKPKSRHQKVRDKVKQRFVQSPGVFSEGIVSDHIPVIKTVKVRQEAPDKSINIEAKIEKGTETDKKEEIIKYIKQYLQDSDSDLDEKSTFKPIKWDETLVKKVHNEVEPHFYKVKDFSYEKIKPTINLWQLPDSFNFKKEGKCNDFGLTDMDEGKIGKICIRRSGKIDVYLGKLRYELESSSWESFNEHLMSIRVENISHATILGNLQHRYILCPNWNNLL